MPVTWTNWVGNQRCEPARIANPATVDDAVALVREAVATQTPLRVAAGGHSFTPIVTTDGLLLHQGALTGVTTLDTARHRATVLPGTTVGALGEPLWERGLALANQGDIDTQHIAGAVSTGTHGSGVALTTFSGAVTALTIATGTGDVIRIGEGDRDLLAAAQVAVGMLGVMLELELQVVPAYRIRERIELRPFDEVMAGWDEAIRAHRHFSYFWLPSATSAALYGLVPPAGGSLVDQCYVKVYDEADADEPDTDVPGGRVDRAYRIYPSDFEPNFHELEYFVPLHRGPDAVRAMRELMLARLPDSIFPMEVRTTAADGAYLSPAYQTETCVISVSGVPGTEYWPYLREVDSLLDGFDARVHWGKLHFLTPERLHRLYPMAARFVELRRELDPHGLFLNEHLQPLFRA